MSLYEFIKIEIPNYSELPVSSGIERMLPKIPYLYAGISTGLFFVSSFHSSCGVPPTSSSRRP